jgi:hypothetical protein
MINRATLILILGLFLLSDASGQTEGLLIPYLIELIDNADDAKDLYSRSVKIQEEIQDWAKNADWIGDLKTAKDIISQTDKVVCMIQDYHLLEAMKAYLVDESSVSSCLDQLSDDIVLIKANWIFDQTELIMRKLAMDPADRQSALDDIVNNIDELIYMIDERTGILRQEINEEVIGKVTSLTFGGFEIPEKLGPGVAKRTSALKNEIYDEPKYEHGIDIEKLKKGQKAIIRIGNKAINIILLLYMISMAWAIMRGREVGRVLINVMLAIVIWDIIKIVLG